MNFKQIKFSVYINWEILPLVVCIVFSFIIQNTVHIYFFLIQTKIMKNNEKQYLITYSTKKYNISQMSKKSPIFLLLIGLIIGFINGFWGGGGGMLCVPALTYLVGLNEKKSHATTILIMLPLCIASFVIYVINGYLEWDLVWTTGAGFVVGGLIGAYLLKGISNNILKIIFSIVILAGGVWLLI